MVKLLLQTSKKEAKEIKKKELKKYDSDSDSDLSDLDSDTSSSLEEGFHANEEFKEAHEGDGSGFEMKNEGGMVDSDTHDLFADVNNEEPDDSEAIMEAHVSLFSGYDMMRTRLKTIDEFKYFQNTIRQLYQKYPDNLSSLVQQMSPGTKKALDGII